METIYSLVFDWFGLFCHQLPDRSLHIGGIQLPLCVRCTTISLGGLTSIAYLFTRRPPVSRVRLSLLAIPMITELALSYIGSFETTNTIRALTGFGFGFSALLAALQWLAGLNAGESVPVQRITAGLNASPEASSEMG